MTENDKHTALPRDMLTVHELSYVTALSERIIQRLISIEVIEPDNTPPSPAFEQRWLSACAGFAACTCNSA